VAWGNQPAGSEQVTVEIQLGLRHPVEIRDHSRPVDLDQGTDQGAKPDQFVASARAQPDRGTLGTVTPQAR
jgi:hypothetical protein